MVYADFNYYTYTYMGAILDETSFPRLALRASAYLDYITMGRAAGRSQLDAVKMACCAVAEQYKIAETANLAAARSLSKAAETAETQELQSQSVGSYSKSYKSGGDSAKAALNAVSAQSAAVLEVATMYLAPAGLLMARGYYT